MIRNILAMLAALVIAIGLIIAIQFLGHTIYPVPSDLDPADADAMQAYVATLPLPALLFPLFAYFGGTFAGSFAGALLGTHRPVIFASVVGVLVLAGTIANLILISHPLWFSVFAVIGIVVSAWLAVLLAKGIRSSV